MLYRGVFLKFSSVFIRPYRILSADSTKHGTLPTMPLFQASDFKNLVTTENKKLEVKIPLFQVATKEIAVI